MADYEMLEVGAAGDVTIVGLQVAMLEETKIRQLAAELDSLVDAGQAQQLVINLSPVNFLNSSAIGVLISLHKKVHSSGGAIKLCHMNPDIRSMFKITQVDRLFDIHQTQAEAVASFS